MKQAHLVIYRSANGRDNWQPIPAAEVPEFVKDQDTMGRLIAGEECMDAGEGLRGSSWYRAVPVVTQAERDMIGAGINEARTLH